MTLLGTNIEMGGADPAAVLDSMYRRIDALQLDLNGLTVVTEAATGAYACTAVIAAIAGARVRAIARSTRRHGSAADASAATLSLARQAGVAARIKVAERLSVEMLGDCDILTNCGHLRPITKDIIDALPSRAVIALMFEAWEFRETDLDLPACRDRGIRVAAVNERHPDVAVFPFLGPLCVRLMQDGGAPTSGQRIALVCDNPFEPYLRSGLALAGATVASFATVAAVPADDWGAVVLALNPARSGRLANPVLTRLAACAPGARLVQFWGDIDRAAAHAHGFSLLPLDEPAPGHMGLLLNALGHEPIVRLQTGGMRAAELVLRGFALPAGGVGEIL